ncbi:MAG: hypothetical protein ACOX6N_02390 [Patescibacteria group bacterium]|jgi:hypothetical protein
MDQNKTAKPDNTLLKPVEEGSKQQEEKAQQEQYQDILDKYAKEAGKVTDQEEKLGENSQSPDSISPTLTEVPLPSENSVLNNSPEDAGKYNEVPEYEETTATDRITEDNENEEVVPDPAKNVDSTSNPAAVVLEEKSPVVPENSPALPPEGDIVPVNPPVAPTITAPNTVSESSVDNDLASTKEPSQTEELSSGKDELSETPPSINLTENPEDNNTETPQKIDTVELDAQRTDTEITPAKPEGLHPLPPDDANITNSIPASENEKPPFDLDSSPLPPRQDDENQEMSEAPSPSGLPPSPPSEPQLNRNDLTQPSSDNQPPPSPPPAPPSVPASGSGLFKILFFLSLVVFLIVAAANVYSLVTGKQINLPFLNSSLEETMEETAIPSPSAPTSIPSQFCDFNGKQYLVGESFVAQDGCNTCTCQESLELACTEIDCGSPINEATPEAESTTSAESP